MPTPLPIGDPRHGTVAGSSAGCNCQPCRKAKAAYNTRRTRQIAYGRWQPWVNAEPARQHLRHLSTLGIGWEQAADLAGLPPATVSRLLYPRNGRPPARRCRKTTLDAILAVNPTLDDLSPGTPVNAIGTVRRLRALVAIGYPMQWLGNQLPTHPEHARRLIRHGQERVTATVARAARDLYDKLRDTPPEDTPSTRRTRTKAAQLGWDPPSAWDGLDIDDPTDPDTPDPTLVDEIAIERAMRGDHSVVPALTDHEREILARRLLTQGISLAKTRAITGIRERALRQLRDTIRAQTNQHTLAA